MNKSNFRVGVVLMQKNEYDLFPIFVAYYGWLVGYENIFVFDNGSSKEMLPKLQDAIDLGVNIDFTKSSIDDFKNKGRLVGEKINLLKNRYDVVIPLDCDEFVGLETKSDNFTFRKDLIISYLKNLENGIHEVKLGNRFRNHLSDFTKFYRYKSPPKLFIKRSTVTNLDLGYHSCEESILAKPSSLCYFEFHNKPFEIYHRHAILKMENRIDIANIEKYRNYKGMGHHLVKYICEGGEELYFRHINSKKYINIPGLKDRYNKLGIEIPMNLIVDKHKLDKYKKFFI